MTREKALKKTVRERMARTGEPYTSARARILARSYFAPAGTGSVVVTNGDSVAGTLREAGLAQVVIPWRDVLHEGPVPPLPPARLRRVRARYLAARYGRPAAAVLQEFAERDQALAGHARAGLSLWFEADLYDQLQLIEVVARLSALRVRPASVSQISIGEHPDRAHFAGLGELTGAELAALAPGARPLTEEGFALARRAWAAFTAPDPTDLVALKSVISRDLRFLGDAIGRLLQEYPSVSDGLSVTQRRVLLAVERGRTTFPQLLRAHWETESRPFFGDAGYQFEVRALAEAPVPALAFDGERYALTEAGRRLLAAHADWVALNGLDRWIGGVHLAGRAAGWRYDERRELLLRTRPGEARDASDPGVSST